MKSTATANAAPARGQVHLYLRDGTGRRYGLALRRRVALRLARDLLLASVRRGL